MLKNLVWYSPDPCVHFTEDLGMRLRHKEPHLWLHHAVRFLSLLPSKVHAALLVSWLIYECSDTVELAVIAGGSNNEMLTNVDTCN